ncbi:Aldehyde dehydrogenase [Pleurostoma richardsiae]|uniref:aldehyde dehydrogenase (NAD(+)) n=1 Tax=Pleurostoma richardsiae TaxID=41990 RepID=A0AA38VF08_9PEZI|nr:Aldehyde dehydrogenase [Pleurostoma richardsiae]
MAAIPTHEMWVGGELKPGKGEIIEVENPANGLIVARVHQATAEDVHDTVLRAHQAFKSGVWSQADRQKRAKVLDDAASIIEIKLDVLIEEEVMQTGRAIREMRAQVPSLVKWFRYYAALLRTEERSVLPTTGKLHNWIDRVPLGVVALITPFNHPLLIAVKKIAPALAAGNSVVLKPSEWAPVTSIILGKLLKAAGLPDGVFSVIPGRGAFAGKYLSEHQLIRKVDITGGTAAGRGVGAITGHNMARITAELGGKAPVIVTEYADVQAAVNGVCFGAFIASGQTCVAATRIIVHNEILDKFTDALLDKVDSITCRIGNPMNSESTMGPVINVYQLDKLSLIVAGAVSTGKAKVLVGGERMTGTSLLDGTEFSKGYFFPPTVVISTEGQSVTKTELWENEAFGPIIVVVGYDTDEQAVALANDSRFGLGAAVWTRDISQAMQLSDKIEAGIVWINTHHRNDPSSPWGGIKPDSGVGSENGIEAYHAYTQIKSTIINYASIEEMLETEDWFAESAGGVRYG